MKSSLFSVCAISISSTSGDVSRSGDVNSGELSVHAGE